MSCTGRLVKKDRKRNMTEELMADQALATTHKRRFGKLQDEAQRWRHKKVKHTNNERTIKRKPKPKH